MRWTCVRFTVQRIMLAVVIAAANFAYLRRYGRVGTLVGTCLPVLILQAGFLGALRSRDSTRRFWLGFVAFGSLALIGWCGVDDRFPETTDAYYGRAMDAVLRRFPLAGHDRLIVFEPSHQALAEVLLTIPQLLVALMGGMLALRLSRPLGPSPPRTQPAE
jgi:hypothetical protein